MCRPKGYGFCAVSIWKTGIVFVHFGLESGMVVEGTTRVYERILSFQFQMIKKKDSTRIQNEF